MAQGTVHVDESGAVPKIDISIINEKSVAVSIFRLEPNTFEEEPVVELGSGEEINIPVWVTDCLVAKVGGEVVGEFGVCEDLREWRVPGDDPENGHHCRFLVENHRAESVRLLCTAGEDGETLLIQVLDPGAQTVLDSFSGDYWEAMIGDQVVSAYQPSARLPVWEIDNLVCDFVPDLEPHGNENLNETSEPRRIDQPAIGEVKAVMVFVIFPMCRPRHRRIRLARVSLANRRNGSAGNLTVGCVSPSRLRSWSGAGCRALRLLTTRSAVMVPSMRRISPLRCDYLPPTRSTLRSIKSPISWQLKLPGCPLCRSVGPVSDFERGDPDRDQQWRGAPCSDFWSRQLPSGISRSRARNWPSIWIAGFVSVSSRRERCVADANRRLGHHV